MPVQIESYVFTLLFVNFNTPVNSHLSINTMSYSSCAVARRRHFEWLRMAVSRVRPRALAWELHRLSCSVDSVALHLAENIMFLLYR